MTWVTVMIPTKSASIENQCWLCATPDIFILLAGNQG